MIPTVYELKKYFNSSGIFLCLCGPISQDLLSEVGDTLRAKLKLENAKAHTVFRVFSILVEQTQNIIHYSAERIPPNGADDKAKELSSGIIAVGREDGHYFVLCGNIIRNEAIDSISGKIEKVRSMDKDQPNQYYRHQRRLQPEESSKGAGLGFIELARKASKPIEYEFKPIDENVSFFSVKTVI